MSEPITCLICDDHEVVREGLRLSLSRSENIRVVGEAADGNAAVTLAKRRQARTSSSSTSACRAWTGSPAAKEITVRGAGDVGADVHGLSPSAAC